MNRKLILAALAIVSIAGSAPAQDMPPGKWWRRNEVAQRLALTPDQQTRLDQVFHDAAEELIDRKSDVEKANLALRREIDQPQINRQNLQRMAARLSEARGKLFEREVLMLADMRGVLNDQQWAQLRAHLDRQRDRERRPPPKNRPPR